MGSYLNDAGDLRAGYLDASRQLLAPRYGNIHPDRIAGILRETMERLPPMERDTFAALSLQNAYENIFKDIGKKLGPIAKVVAPIVKVAAPLVGTMVGGPAGGLLGKKVGNMVGKLAGNIPGKNPPPTPDPTTSLQQITEPAPLQNPAAGQLMAIIGNPQFLMALLGQVLGGAGNGNALVQQDEQAVTIPFGALMNTLSELAQQAAEESMRMGGGESENYLLDAEGYYRVNDPSDPRERAEAVVEMFREDYAWRTNMPEELEDTIESYDPVTEWLVSAGMVR